MANTLPASTIVSAEQFPQFRNSIAKLNRYSKDFSAEVVSEGTTVRVGYESNYSASLWAGSYVSTDSSVSSVDVTLKEPYYVELYLSPNEVRAYGEGKLTKRIGAAAAGVFDELAKQATTALQSAATVNVASLSASAFTFSSVLSGSTILANSGSTGTQTFLAPRTVYNALISDAKNSNYEIAVTSTDGQEVLKYALLPNVEIVPDANLTFPIIATQDAVAIATAIPEQMSGHNRTLVADTGKTEAVIAVDTFQDGVAGKNKMRAHIMAGVATGRPGAAAKYTLL